MKTVLILLQLTLLFSCANQDLHFPVRALASPLEGDTCKLLVQSFLKTSPLEKRTKLLSKLKKFEELKTERKNMLHRLVDWTRNQYAHSYAEKITNALDALLFIDYKDSFSPIYQASLQKIKLNEAGLERLYGNSFNNYIRASRYLSPKKSLFNLELFKNTHFFMMEGGVDGIPLETIGKMRVVNMSGLIRNEIPSAAVEEMKKNIYLSVGNLFLNPKTGKYKGVVNYASIDNMQPALQEKLKEIAPDLYEEILKFNSKKIGNHGELTEKFVTALTEDLLSWFVKQRDDLGRIETASGLYEYSRLVATFQKALISIHPFRDGNGRTIRQFAIYHAFDSIGFPKPRLLNPDDDLFTSVDEWTEAIVDGMRNTQRLYENFEERLEQGLPLETTPELLIARFKENEKIHLKKEKPKSVTMDYREKEVDINQIHTYFLLQLKNPVLHNRMQTEPSVAYNEVLKNYVNFYKKSNLDYIHEKKGLENLSLNLIDSDFVTTFGNRSYQNFSSWQFKMKKWYTDTIVWRGLSRRNEEIKESEILSMFTTINQQFVSNNVARQLNGQLSEEKIHEIIFQDFYKYNEDLISDSLEKMAKDHSETGPLYGKSYGYSTSSKREVGKAFAMGAMVIAPYGEHKELQHLLKSRVLVGMKQGKKDVILSRLKQMRPDFSYKYPRQQEVMGIGGADPDFVMFVQLIDEKGQVFKSYVRNPKKPDEIWVVKKELSSLEELDLLGDEEIYKIAI